MCLSRWAAAIVLAGITLTAALGAPKPPPREGDGATGPAAKPKLQLEISITHGGKTTKATTAAAALTKIQTIQKLAARAAAKPAGGAPAEGAPAEGASDFSATFALNGDTQEVGDPAEAEKVCKRINEALVKARKAGEDLASVKIPTEDAPMAEGLPGAGDKPEGKGPRRPIRKNGEGPPMQNPMNPFPGAPPMGGFNGPGGPVGPIPPQQGGNGNGNGLERLLERVPPQARPLVMQRIGQWRQMNNGQFPDPNTVMQIIGQTLQALQNGQIPGAGNPPAVPKM